MADLSFDAVIIGGGCKGLSTGMYLAKYGGMSVGIFEATHELGGGLATAQAAPGFEGNPHCTTQADWYYYGLIKDDLPEIFEEGFKQVGRGMNCKNVLFPDDTCLTLYGPGVDPDASRSAAQIARFSERDAETYLRIRKVWLEHLKEPFIEEAFSVPPPVGTPGPLAKAFMKPEVINAGLDPHLAAMSPIQGVKTVYESDAVRVLFLRIAQSAGMYADDIGTALGLIATFYMTFDFAIAYRGIHNLAHAMQRVNYRYGGKTFSHSEVDKVIIENGVAKGIQLKDGTQIEAKKAVVSTLSPRQLCHDLIGPDYISPLMMRKVDALEVDRLLISFYNFVLTEQPRFKAASFNPDVDSEELRMGLGEFTMGGMDTDQLLAECCYRKMHQIHPEPMMLFVTMPRDAEMTHDPKSDYCNCHAEVATPPANAYSDEWWEKYHHELAEYMMKRFQEYMVDMDWDKVVGITPTTPYNTAKRLKNMAPEGNWGIIDQIPSQMGSFRPIPELAQHRTPIKGLYATGAAFGGWGHSSLCSAYSCYKVMAEDYGLRKPWEEQGRPY